MERSWCESCGEEFRSVPTRCPHCRKIVCDTCSVVYHDPETEVDKKLCKDCNLKKISEYANNIRMELKAKPTNLYNSKEYGELAFKEIIKANFEIACDDRKIPLETQLCLGEIVTSKIQ